MDLWFEIFFSFLMQTSTAIIFPWITVWVIPTNLEVLCFHFISFSPKYFITLNAISSLTHVLFRVYFLNFQTHVDFPYLSLIGFYFNLIVAREHTLYYFISIQLNLMRFVLWLRTVCLGEYEHYICTRKNIYSAAVVWKFP